MIENNPENNLQTEPKKFFTAQARRAHVREYQVGSESMIAYCDKHHLALSTFKIWVAKYGEKKMPSAFVPIAMAPKDTPTKINRSTSLHHVEIQISDIKIIFPEISHVETLIQFIKGLSHANSVKSTSNIIL